MPIVGLSHPRAVTRIPDPIHGVIELTVFDRDIVDSRPFQRLHFVLQQSVSYASFPANKNTRFPHSLGTAHIVGRLFSSALSNSAPTTLKNFITDAASFIARLFGYISNQPRGLGPKSTQGSGTLVLRLAHEVSIAGVSGFRHAPMSQTKINSRSTNGAERIDSCEEFQTDFGPLTAGFIIDTIWQALRIYALTHDIGHLPMSHAFEEAISHVKDNLAENFPETDISGKFSTLLSEARRDFSGLDRLTEEADFFDLLKTMLGADKDFIEAQINSKALHEVRSFSILNNLFVKGSFLSDAFGNLNPETGRALDLYSRLISNLALCIIYSPAAIEKSRSHSPSRENIHPASFLYAVRRLVDGTVDGDRLDYTLRDCHSAGTRFGDFDLERIIRNAVLVSKEAKRLRVPSDTVAKGERPSDGGTIPCHLYAFGFGPEALPGIEQFFEARYQSYKYLVHHRTASRSNIVVESLIEHLFSYAVRDPSSEVAEILERFSYIQRREKEITAVLPVYTEAIEEIDDASLRTLLHQTNRFFRSDRFLKRPQKKEWEENYANRITALCEIVLFRDFRHVGTLFRNQTPVSTIVSELGLSQAEADILFADVYDNIEEFMKQVRKSIINFSKIGLNSPAILLHERALPKVFDNPDVTKDAFERVTWVLDPRGILLPVGDPMVSRQLADMSKSRSGDRKIRLYVASRDLRADANQITLVEKLVIEQLRAWRVAASAHISTAAEVPAGQAEQL